jgi:peptidylprolyl isomerase
MVVMVIAVDDKEITLDANHPLAGEDLTFELEMIEIK